MSMYVCMYREIYVLCVYIYIERCMYTYVNV